MALTFTGTHERIEAERKAALPNAADVRLFRDYARGRQRGTLTAGQQRILRGMLGNLFCDNVCKVVIKAVRNRLRFQRYEVAGEGGRADAISRFLEDLEIKNNLQALLNSVFWATLRDGNHGVSLSWNGKRVVLSRERYWNGLTGLFVAYDDDDTPTYAVKEWKDGTRLRRTVWWPERIEKYAQNGKGWEFFADSGDPLTGPGGGAGPIPWTRNMKAGGEPLGIPVVHFINQDMPNDGPGNDDAMEPDSRQGMSVLDGGLLGLQDALNDIHRDMLAAARFTGYQVRYGTGITPPKDGKASYQVEPGAFFLEPNEAAKFGTMEAGSIDQLVLAREDIMGAVRRHSDVPSYEFDGSWPSGVALLLAQISLTEKAETLGASWGPNTGSLGHKASILENVFGLARLDEELPITTVFAPVSRNDPITLSQIAAAEAPFVSLRETLRTLNRSPQQIDRILQEREEEAARFNPVGAINVQRAQIALQRDQASGNAQQQVRDRLAGAAAGNGAVATA